MSKKYKVIKNGNPIETKIPGKFAGITTTKIFGRLNCKSGMRANKENRIFFAEYEDAIKYGFRPCKICRPVNH